MSMYMDDISEHKPLQSLLDGKHPVSSPVTSNVGLSSSACMSMILNATQRIYTEMQMPSAVLMGRLELSPVTATQIKNWTLKDPLLSQVLHYI